jgi:hypothetical protein
MSYYYNDNYNLFNNLQIEEIEYIKYFEYFYPLNYDNYNLDNKYKQEIQTQRYINNKLLLWISYHNNNNIHIYKYSEWQIQIYIPRIVKQLEKMKIKKQINLINVCFLISNKYLNQLNV